MLVECKDVIKIYPSPVEGLKFSALRGVNLEVKKGDLIAIIGPSGAGKTTLLRLISTYDVPSSGEIWYDGKLLNKYTWMQKERYRQEQIGMMYQSPTNNLLWGLSAYHNVILPMRYAGKFIGKQKERTLELLERVGLKGKEHRKPAELSGGEQQRVAIAKALSRDPKLFLADEPTGELDSHTTMMIIEYLKELNRDLGTTIVVATHDKRFSRMTNRSYKIQDGRLTTYQLTVTKPDVGDIRHEVVIVDGHGNLRLPEEALIKFKSLNAVEVIIKDDRIELIPFEYENQQEIKSIKSAQQAPAKEDEADE
ncbi:MAG: ABC transporter ATP-binding protein [Promethearchaeota archaeon]